MPTRGLARYFAATVIFICLAGTAELGVADLWKQSSSAALVRVGLRLTPGDAAGWTDFAAKTSGPESRAALETASRLNPRNSAVWIQRGLRAEAEGDLKEARRNMNRAIEQDRDYFPLWTLANFCLRHGDERYAPLLRQALGIAVVGAQDPVPVFDLAWQARDDAPFILANIVGNDPAALRPYVSYLVDRGRTDALIAPALALAASRNPEDRPNLMNACESLMTGARAPDALKLWNRIGIGTLDPDHGDVVTNGALRTPAPLGFDWKFNSSPDHSIDFQGAFQGSGAGARIEFTGRQPEIVDLLRQPVPVNPGQRYTLRWQAKALPSTTPARLLWVLTALHSDAPFARADIAMNANTGWTDGEALVTIPPNIRFASLLLRLERRLGEPRFTGVVWIGQTGMRHAQ
jgi:tetratricopeptide (TPR) repeat protein